MDSGIQSIPRNVVLDLLPAYIAGEASEETRALVEAYAKSDDRIAELIRAGKLEPEAIAPWTAAPEDLEMKTIKRLRGGIRRQMIYVALATAALLMIPLAAMQFTEEVNWTAFDFVVMGLLLSGAGFVFVLVTRASENLAYRTGVGVAVAAGLLLIWVSLAVGIIGSEDHPANALYLAVILVGLVGAGIARLKPRGMSRTLLAAAVTQMLVPAAALVVWRPALEEPPGLVGVFLLNAIFAALFGVSALLFRRAHAADSV